MARSEYNIPNQSGSGFRSDLNIALAAIRTNNSGAGAPTNQFDYMQYVEDTAGDPNVDVVYQRGRTTTFYRLYKIGGPHYFQDGTAAAPSLTFDSDVDTGIFSAAANEIGFSTAGSERLRIDSAGNLGVNTTNPAEDVDISASAPTLRLTDTNTALADDATSSSIEFYQNDAGGAGVGASIKAVGDGTSGDLALTFSSGANTEAARFNLSGWFGINTTDPLQRFHCDGTALFSKDTGTEEVTVRTQTTSASGSTLTFQKSRGSAASPTTVTDGDTVGRIKFEGYTGSAYETGFEIVCEAKTQDGGTGLENSFAINNGGAERLRIGNLGSLICQGVYDNTVASGDSVSVNSTGALQRITSSIKYKTSVETLEDSYADALLGCRPVWYRSTCEGDNAEHSFWGFIAEEVAAIDPRLVNFKTVEVTYDDESRAIETPCTPEPESVMYDRFVPHLLNLIKRQKTAIEALEARVTALENV